MLFSIGTTWLVAGAACLTLLAAGLHVFAGLYLTRELPEHLPYIPLHTAMVTRGTRYLSMKKAELVLGVLGGWAAGYLRRWLQSRQEDSGGNNGTHS